MDRGLGEAPGVERDEERRHKIGLVAAALPALVLFEALSTDGLWALPNNKSSALHKLPDNCSLEDIQYHLDVLDKVRRGVDDARQQGAVSQEDAEKRLSPWLSESGRRAPSRTSKRSRPTLPRIHPPTPTQLSKGLWRSRKL